MPYEADTAIGGAGRRFPSTRRSLIASAGSGGTMAREALGAVLEVYWKPVYKHVRIRWNRGNEEAKDLTQGFFAGMLEDDMLAKFDPAKALFRTYLRACVDRFVMKQDQSAGRMKRGAGVEIAALDFESAERELSAALRDETVEDRFHREWQRQIFTLAIEDLRARCEVGGKSREFALFEQYDLAEAARPRYEDLAVLHGVAVTAVTNALAWARRELRACVKARVESVAGGAAEARAEFRRLMG